MGFIEDLQSKNFTCNFSPSGLRFNCVRFGCKRAFLFSKYLMQWSVSPEILNSNAYNATTIDYQLAKGCYRPEDVTKEQEKFVFRHGQLEMTDCALPVWIFPSSCRGRCQRTRLLQLLDSIPAFLASILDFPAAFLFIRRNLRQVTRLEAADRDPKRV
ncbi:hypothetical protein [Pararhizobium sp. A13]|uniref:hypothetical protein n=1 Tax=Pararhizobium sp. A13 TaxID=3133975 RepID=UPI00325403FF